MRLIDADETIKQYTQIFVEKYGIGCGEMFQGVFKQMPTAYNVDKVVEELKNNTYNMKICEEIPSKRKYIATFVDKEYKMIKLDDAIEIVKGGEIDG